MSKKTTRILAGQTTKNKAKKVKQQYVNSLVSLGVKRETAKRMIKIEPTRSVKTKSGNLAPRFKVIGRYNVK